MTTHTHKDENTSTKKQEKLYRQGVGIIIVKDDKVFVGDRIKKVTAIKNGKVDKANKNKGNMQIPQGGIDEGELISEALYRELLEETGLKKDDVRVMESSSFKTKYDLPAEMIPESWGGKYAGQEHTWFKLELISDESAINLNSQPNPEFSSYMFIKPKEAIKLAFSFKKDIYKKVFKEFGL